MSTNEAIIDLMNENDRLRAHIKHDIECVSAAYAALIERAENGGDRDLATKLRREWHQYQNRSLAILHDEREAGK